MDYGRTPEGRPIVFNPAENGFSTEFTATVNDPRLNGGQFTNIPTIFSGKFVDPRIAIQKVIQAGGYDPDTGRRLLGYRSLAAAELAAKQRTQELNAQVGPRLQRLEQTYLAPGSQFSGR